MGSLSGISFRSTDDMGTSIREELQTCRLSSAVPEWPDRLSLSGHLPGKFTRGKWQFLCENSLCGWLLTSELMWISGQRYTEIKKHVICKYQCTYNLFFDKVCTYNLFQVMCSPPLSLTAGWLDSFVFVELMDTFSSLFHSICYSRHMLWTWLQRICCFRNLLCKCQRSRLNNYHDFATMLRNISKSLSTFVTDPLLPIDCIVPFRCVAKCIPLSKLKILFLNLKLFQLNLKNAFHLT